MKKRARTESRVGIMCSWEDEVVKNPSVNAGDASDAGLMSGGEDAMEKGMETHSSTFA